MKLCSNSSDINTQRLRNKSCETISRIKRILTKCGTYHLSDLTRLSFDFSKYPFIDTFESLSIKVEWLLKTILDRVNEKTAFFLFSFQCKIYLLFDLIHIAQMSNKPLQHMNNFKAHLYHDEYYDVPFQFCVMVVIQMVPHL